VLEPRNVVSATGVSTRADLAIEHVSVAYGWGDARFLAVNDVSLAIQAGRTLGLIGESGSGKSTLARSIVGLTRVTAGRIRLGSRDVTNASGPALSALRSDVQMVFQDPYSSLNPRMSVAQLLMEALGVARRKRGGHTERAVTDMLGEVELPPLAATRYPHQLSGGQRQRVALARALAVQPKILVLDEVTSALDVSVQAAILNLLRRIQESRRLACLMISHDLSVVSYMSDQVSVMYLGRVVEEGPTRQLLEHPRHPYTRALLDSVPVLGKRLTAAAAGEVADPHKPPSGCPFHPRCAIGPATFPARRACVTNVPELLPANSDHAAACHYAIGSSASAN
jgi:peptide/nickel transport system ATP-binding protein